MIKSKNMEATIRKSARLFLFLFLGYCLSGSVQAQKPVLNAPMNSPMNVLNIKWPVKDASGMNTTENVTVLIHDLLGRTVVREEIQLREETNRIRLHTGNLPDGIYILRIYSDVYAASMKFFISANSGNAYTSFSVKKYCVDCDSGSWGGCTWQWIVDPVTGLSWWGCK